MKVPRWNKVVAVLGSLAILALSPISPAAAADNQNLVASYNFTGGSVTDSTGDYDLALYDGAKVEKYGDRNNNEALSLRGDGQYAQFPDDLFASVGNDFTMEFSAKSRSEDTGNYFSFALGRNSTNYLFSYLSTKNVKSVISKTSWNNEEGFKVEADGAVWHNYKLVLNENELALYSDGELLGYSPVDVKLADLGGTTAYLGKSFYSGDKYWDGAIDDIKIYDKADPIVLPESVNITSDGEASDTLQLQRGAVKQLDAAITPVEADSKAVTWESSDPSVVRVDESGKIEALKDGLATVSATPLYGNGAPGKLEIAVTPATPEQIKQYLQEDTEAVLAALPKETTENLSLTTVGPKHGSDLSWKSADEALVTSTNAQYTKPAVGASDPYEGGGIVTRPLYGDGDVSTMITPIATLDGQTITGDATKVVIKERTRTAPDVGYAAATFESDAAGGESIWISSTENNDFFSFTTRNNGNPAIVSDADTGGLRDAFILRSHDGDKYYLIATDLKVSAQGWSQNQQYGSHKIEAYESRDLVHWTRTNGDGNGGIVVNSPEAGMTWAPEAYWDDVLQSYVVFFSSRMYTDETRTTPVTSEDTGRSSYAQVRFSLTRDFVTFTPPQTWQDTGYSRIDSTVMKIGDYYYRFTKNEEGGSAGDFITTGKAIFLERSKILTAPTTHASPDTDPEHGWQLLEQNILPFEGPEVVRLNANDPINTIDNDGYILLSDQSSYRAFMTTGEQLSQTSWDNTLLSRFPNFRDESKPVTPEPGANGFIAAGAEGGLPEKVRHGAFTNVPQSVLTALEGWTSIEAVDSTTTATYDEDSRLFTVKVTAADDGTVAGSVTLAAGSWKTTMKLASDGTAEVTVPDDVKGDVSVAYDGYTDGLVSPSSTSVKGILNAPHGDNESQNQQTSESVVSPALAVTGSAAGILVAVAFALLAIGLLLKKLVHTR